jgi:hypothetical protein
MNDIQKKEHLRTAVPNICNEPEPTVVRRVDLTPRDASDSWRRFLDHLRAIVGAMSLHACERLADAKIREVEAGVNAAEVEIEIKLLKAKQEHEVAMARIEESRLLAEVKADKEKAHTDHVRARTQALEALTRLAEKALDARKLSRDEARIWLEAAVQRIEVGPGASVGTGDADLSSNDDRSAPSD